MMFTDKVIQANTIDEAAGQILNLLKGEGYTTFYFDGWDGLGASAVLRAVVRHLTMEAGSRAPAAAGLEYSHIFHIDCSKWESRRDMQRVIAKQLKLPASVMEMFDAQDEKDDFDGVAKGSRVEIKQVAEAIYRYLQKQDSMFLVIFHNGIREIKNIDNIRMVISLGLPLYDSYKSNKILWSLQGRFRAYPRAMLKEALEKIYYPGEFLSANSIDIGEDNLSDILSHEAEEVAREMINVGGIDWPAVVANCFLYTVKLSHLGNHLANVYDFNTHICNYWRCDGIVPLLQANVDSDDDGVDTLWISSDAMQHEMRLDAVTFLNPYFPSPVGRCMLKHMAYWTSPTHGLTLIPDRQISRGMFQHLDKLYVLKLSECTFSYTSPPFLCCHSIRFLWLDHCKDTDEVENMENIDKNKWVDEVDGVHKKDVCHFMQRLWVLDVRYSAFMNKNVGMMNFKSLRELYVMGNDNFGMELSRELCNIRKLRVTKSHVNDTVTTLSRMDKIEVLDLSENEFVTSLMVESCSNLETFIINGSTGLQGVSLMQCTKLKNILMSGSFPDLASIDITCVGIQKLDLNAVVAPSLDKLSVLNCENLCAILWPQVVEGQSKINLHSLYIDTMQKEGTTVVGQHRTTGRSPSEFDWHISVKDTRILGSFWPIEDNFSQKDTHVEISSPRPPHDDAIGKNNRFKSTREQQIENSIYRDVATTFMEYTNIQQQQLLPNEGKWDPPLIMCLCPPPPYVPSQGCYLHIEDNLITKSQASSMTLPGFICDGAKILHMHDSLHTTSILADPLASVAWDKLEWCRVEGCLKLACVFKLAYGGPEQNDNDINMFKKLRTTWASNLPNAQYIWELSNPSKFSTTFLPDMTFLHIDCCPRLISILDIPMFKEGLNNLQILEIMWCGDLSVAIHLRYNTVNNMQLFLPKIKHICLYELPKLKSIANTDKRILAPELESIKIRGCWSIRTLPIVRSNKVVECDCEKEWWDKLKWESAEHASYYRPIHPRYYRKTMLRGSVLR